MFNVSKPCLKRYLELLRSWRYHQALMRHQSEATNVSGFAGGCLFKGKDFVGLTPGFDYVDQTYLASTTRDLVKNTFPEFIYSSMEQKNFVISFSRSTSSSRSCRNGETSNVPIVSRNDIRRCIGSCVQALQRRGIREIFVDPCGDPEAAAEGAFLSAFVYDELKGLSRQMVKPDIACYTGHLELDFDGTARAKEVMDAWLRGSRLAMAQNMARKWMEAPANLLSPVAFATQAADVLESLAATIPNQLTARVRGVDWCQKHRLNGLLAVGSGSHRSVAFLEVFYEGDPSRPNYHAALVGKGVTFDSGGISLKPSAGMEDMRADMGGAAVVVSTIYGLAAMRVPINVRAYIPLCENMPGGKALRPGDVIRLANGMSVQVDNTDAEGRLILADALLLASGGGLQHLGASSPPSIIIDVATLTGAISVALGDEFTGVFCNSAARRLPAAEVWSLETRPEAAARPDVEEEDCDEDEDPDEVAAATTAVAAVPTSAGGLHLRNRSHDSVLECLRYCGAIRGDRVWSMPLLQSRLLKEQGHLADVVNVLGGAAARKGGSGTAASFLNMFVPRSIPWLHMDIAGVMKVDQGENSYLRRGMSGRPTRTLIEFLDQLSRL